MKLELASAVLPALLTDCVLVGHAKRADIVFTPRQWFAMCIHMMNENPSNFFLMPYKDKNDKARFAKAFNAKADDRIQWAWDTITGKAELPASIGQLLALGHRSLYGNAKIARITHIASPDCRLPKAVATGAQFAELDSFSLMRCRFLILAANDSAAMFPRE
jgi:hypothetical protein